MMGRTHNDITSIHVLTIDKSYGPIVFRSRCYIKHAYHIYLALAKIFISKASRSEENIRLIIGSISLSC